MTQLLTKRHIEVAACGEIVTFAIGNVSWSLEFELALSISAALRHHGRIAKLCAADPRNLFAVAGVLTDLNAPKTRRQRWGSALPERLRRHDVAVDNQGQIVRLRIGRITATFPYSEAQKVAKWLRLRGKQAKLKAGEVGHWSQIARFDSVSGLRREH